MLRKFEWIYCNSCSGASHVVENEELGRAHDLCAIVAAIRRQLSRTSAEFVMRGAS